MRPTDIAAALESLLPTKLPMFLWGPPGVGKSSLVAQAARALGADLIDVRAVLLDPVDLRGLPHVNGDNRAHWCLPDFLPREGRGILFLDELAQAPPLVQNACLQLTLDRKLGDYTLPDDWTVVAASNRQEDRAHTHRLSSALSSRFLHLDVDVSNDDWQSWAAQAGVAAEVRSFLRFRPALLHQFPDASARSFPCPRSWEFVGRIVSAARADMLHPVVAGCVGDGAATEFVAFVQVWRSLPDIDQILTSPTSTTVPTEPAVCYALCGAVAERCRKASPDQLSAVAQYVGRLPKEYQIVAMRDCIAANKQIIQRPEGAAWVKANAKFLAGLAA